MVRNSAMCCVPNYGKTRLDNVILHKFPCPINEADRFRTWIYSVSGDVLSLDNQFIHKYRKVCHIHFEEKFINRSGRLSAIAVPTLHLKGMATQTASVQIASNFQQPLQDDHVPRAPLMNITNQYNAGGDDTSRPSTSGMATPTASLKIASNLQEPLHYVPRAPLINITNAAAHDASRPTISDHTPPYTPQFCSEASSLAKHIKKLTETKDKYAVRLKKAMSLSTNTAFQKAIGKFTTMALLFVMMQFREINKKKMGRRFTKQEKIMALSLYKQGPKAYRWLRHIFVLPSPLTLSRMISAAALKAGINDNIFENLKKKGQKNVDI
ncbi:uncharacterized protein LOC134661343 [Cydia amplana]|uniref:uncharacterized protein LOC134661343 n=1 Tax=Cydia amplana TaxID=1869771 RepID=UPI002FE5A275